MKAPTETPTTRRRLRDLVFALLPGTAFMTVFVLRNAWDGSRWRFTLFDDALISMAYGRTLATTGEWVWFPGAERVQGITNPLWSAIMALVHVPFTSPSLAIITMTILGVVLVLATAIVLYFAILSATSNTPIALAVAAGTPVLYPLTFWAVRGMEVGLLALLSSIAVLAVVRVRLSNTQQRKLWLSTAALVGCAAVFTRLDALVLIITIIGIAFLTSRSSERLQWLAVGAIVVVAAAAVFAFQDFYWGDVLPNTYRLKVEGVSIQERLARGVFATAKAIPLLILVIIGWCATWRSRDPSRSRLLIVGLSSAVVAVALAYSVWTGGDAWEWSLVLNRTISAALPIGLVAWMVGTRARGSTTSVPILGLVALGLAGLGLGMETSPISFDMRLALIGAGLSSSAAVIVWWVARWSSRQGLHAALMAAAFVIATSAPGLILWATNGGLNVSEDRQFALRSEELALVTDSDARIAVMWAGAPGYYSNRALIDMFGKSDRVIAESSPSIDPNTGEAFPFIPGHNKWDYEYSIQTLRPDVVFQLGDDRASAEQRVLDWGYERRCLSDGWVSYFRSDSSLVKWDLLSPC